MGRAAEPLSSELIQILNDPNSGEKASAARCLAKVAPPEKAVQALTAALRDTIKNFPVNRTDSAVVVTLGALGPAAKSALPALREYLEQCVQDRKSRSELSTIDPDLV